MSDSDTAVNRPAEPATAAAGAAASSSLPPAPAAVPSAHQPRVDLTDAPPDELEEEDLDALLDLEAAMRDEEAAAQAEAEAEGQGGALDEEEEGGGFFRDDGDDPAGASSSLPGASASAPSGDDVVQSLEEDAPARRFASGCRECGNVGVQQSFLTAFGVPVCFRCQRAHPARYQLLTQTTAATRYLLPLTALQTLGHLEKKNPHKQAWGVMKLYWKQDVLRLVRERYGSVEALEAERSERERRRVEKEDNRRKSAQASAARSAAFASTLAASLSEVSRGNQSPAEVAAMLAARTRGMAPAASTARDRSRGKKRRSGARADADADLDAEVEELEEEDHDPLGHLTPAARKRAKRAEAAAAKQKQLHTHVFEQVAEGKQRCKECGFAMEFESF